MPDLRAEPIQADNPALARLLTTSPLGDPLLWALQLGADPFGYGVWAGSTLQAAVGVPNASQPGPYTPFAVSPDLVATQSAADRNLVAIGECLADTLKPAERMIFAPGLIDARGWAFAGAEVGLRYTYTVTPATLHDQLERKLARQAADWAAANPVDVLDLEAWTGLTSAYAALCERKSLSRRAHGLESREPASVAPLFASGQLAILASGVGERRQYVLLGIGARCGYYLLGAGVESAEEGCGAALQLSAARLLAARGVATYDLVGANTPDVVRFKRRLSPTLAPCIQVRMPDATDRSTAGRILGGLKRLTGRV